MAGGEYIGKKKGIDKLMAIITRAKVLGFLKKGGKKNDYYTKE